MFKIHMYFIFENSVCYMNVWIIQFILSGYITINSNTIPTKVLIKQID